MILHKEGFPMESETSEVDFDKIHQKRINKACKTNKVDDLCIEEASQSPNKSAALTKRWSSFVESTTLHGLNYVFSSRTLVRRILWALFFVAAMVWFTFQTSMLLRKYLSYPVTTKVTWEYEDSPEFPAVTICNFNKFNKSVVEAKGYDELLVQFEKKLLGLHIENDSIDFSKHNDFNFTEFYFIAGHQINDTLSSCVWNEQICDYRNFTPVLTEMGLCHTFNSGKDGEHPLKVKQAGSTFGLRLLLNVQQKEYFGVKSTLAGLRILIHRQETIPLVSRLGFAVAPGTSTFVGIEKQRVVNLPKPYESNCSSETISDVPGYPKYTISSCMMICQAKYVIEKCGCREDGMPDINNVKVCGLQETADCLVKEKRNVRTLKDHQCDCPVPCDTISFKPVLSYATLPSESYVRRYAEARFPDSKTLTPNITDQILEYLRQNMVEVHVYFEELSYQVIEQTPAYEIESLLGEIGGQVGLCVGASLLTVLEFIDVIFDIVRIRLGFR